MSVRTTIVEDVFSSAICVPRVKRRYFNDLALRVIVAKPTRPEGDGDD
jgi:hypothetical protein